MCREKYIYKSNLDPSASTVDTISIIFQPVAVITCNFSNMNSAPAIHPNHQRLIDRAREFFAEVEDL
jgi:hypothetical protein